ncbi:MAG: hypothetical protein H0U38_00955 [Chloroflexia bacterium]|jgi:hypothetical protein|nr:hypothetical protein [Chloroflexia bacterium]MDQ3614233.1 hypothetical protein [Chloroflexota bacterium]
MNDTTRTVLIALGVALLVVLLVPLLFMAGMMGAMTGGMGRMMNGDGFWIIGGFVTLILVMGIALIAITARRRQ